MAKKKVLITGMSGLIGGIVRERLEGKYTLSALNRRPVEGIECHQADIADLDAIQPAFDGVDVVVHLAANARGGATWEDLLNPNIIGTYNVFEASRQAGVKAGYLRQQRFKPLAIVSRSFLTVHSPKGVTMRSPKRGIS